MIDCHTHVVPRDFPTYTGRDLNNRWPCMHCDAGHRTMMIGDKPFREITDNAWNPELRLREMCEEGVDRQVLSPMPELFSYWFDLDDALAMGRYLNGTIAELVAGAPDHFFGLGTVPLQDPERAAREVRALKTEFGLIGVEVGSNVNDVPMGDRRFDPFFEAMQEEDMCLFVHALHPIADPRLYSLPLMQPLAAFPNENSLGIISFLVNDVITRFPRLRIAFSHGGGAFAMTLPRLQHGWQSSSELQEAMPRQPITQARKFWYDTLVYHGPTIDYLLEIYGTQQLMIGTDYPFIIRERRPGERLSGLSLSAAVEKSVRSDNCMRFLGLER